MTIEAEGQKLEKEPFIELFTLDLNPLGAAVVFNFTKNINPDGSNIAFGGVEFEPLDFETSGYEWSGAGTFPKPKISFPNAGNLATALINSYGDLTGAKITRLRTYAKYLDGGSEGGQDIHYMPDVYYIEQRTKLTKSVATWVMSSVMDFQGVKLPRRLALRDVCQHTYRWWNGSAFVYGTCPYVGSNNFDENDQPTNSAGDRCSRKLTGCEARFGANNELPTYAFPALARTRV